MTDSTGAPLSEPDWTGAVRMMLAEACEHQGRRARIDEVSNDPADLFNLSSGLPDTLDPSIWIGPGMALLEMPSGARAEWIFDTQSWPTVLAELSEMVEAVLEGSVDEETRHCAGGYKKTRVVFRLKGGERSIEMGPPLPCVGGRKEHTQYHAYPPG